LRYNGTTGIVQQKCETDPEDRIKVQLMDKVHYIKASNLVNTAPTAQRPLSRASEVSNSGSGVGGRKCHTIDGDSSDVKLMAQIMHAHLTAHRHTSPSSSLRKPT
jgi:hypothetical protein